MDHFIKGIIEEQIKKKKSRKEEEIEEIVDDKGNIGRSKKPTDLNTKGITQKGTTDQVVGTAYGTMGTTVHGFSNRMTRYWGENDMSKVLGFQNTVGKNKGKAAAEKYFEKKLGMDSDETDDRLDQLGYDDDLGKKLRLVENPKRFIEEYIDSLLSKKSDSKDLLKKTELNPILKRQLMTIKKNIDSGKVDISDIINFLEGDE